MAFQGEVGDAVEISSTGVPRSQENAHPPRTPIRPYASAYCRGPYGGPRGVRFLMSEVPLQSKIGSPPLNDLV